MKTRDGKWGSLVVGTMMMMCAGTPYMLATFAPALKLRFGFTESQIMTVQTRCC